MTAEPAASAPVAVVTDSVAALPEDLAAAVGVRVVQCPAYAGDRRLPSGRLQAEALAAWLEQGVRTAAPAPGQYLDAIRDATRAGAGSVLVLTVARRLSSAYQAAHLAARRAGCPVQVLDTGTAAGGEALVVLAAAAAAGEGRPLGEVAAAAERAAGRVRVAAVLTTLEYLARGGRLPAAVARAAGWFGMHTLFELRGGAVRPLRPVRSAEAARSLILARWRASRPAGAARLHACALHALAPEAAAALLGAVRAEVEPATAFVAEFDLSMVAHSGPGVHGLAWWWEEAPG